MKLDYQPRETIPWKTQLCYLCLNTKVKGYFQEWFFSVIISFSLNSKILLQWWRCSLIKQAVSDVNIYAVTELES